MLSSKKLPVEPVFISGLDPLATSWVTAMLDENHKFFSAKDQFNFIFNAYRNNLMSLILKQSSFFPFQKEFLLQDNFDSDLGLLLLEAFVKNNLNLEIHHTIKIELDHHFKDFISRRAGSLDLDFNSLISYQVYLNALIQSVTKNPEASSCQRFLIQETHLTDLFPALCRSRLGRSRCILVLRDPRFYLAIALKENMKVGKIFNPFPHLRYYRKLLALDHYLKNQIETKGNLLTIKFEDFLKNNQLISNLQNFLALSLSKNMTSHLQDQLEKINNLGKQHEDPLLTKLTFHVCGSEMAQMDYINSSSELEKNLDAIIEKMSLREDLTYTASDIEFEKRRMNLLNHQEPPTDINEVRKTFLFNETFDSLWSLYQTNRAKRNPAPWHCAESSQFRQPRSMAAYTEHNGKFWLFGGWERKELFNDVWCSEDGLEWQLVSSNAPWCPRSFHHAISFKDKIFIIGGFIFKPPSKVLGDVWSSPDGAEWSQVTEWAPWRAREHLGVVVFKNKIFLFGGCNYGPPFTCFDDVWTSPDGENWECLTDQSPWGPRRGFGYFIFQEKIWLLGGADKNDHLFNDVWCSEDGHSWSLVTSQACWSPRVCPRSVVHQDKMWVMGGNISSSTVEGKNDIWSSTDGEHWTLEQRFAPWSPRSGWEIFSVNKNQTSRIVIVGGFNFIPQGNHYGDIWYLDTSTSNQKETAHNLLS